MNMLNKKIIKIATTLLIIVSLTSCINHNNNSVDERPVIICSTGLIKSAVDTIGGDFVDSRVMIAPTSDPHDYKLTEHDVTRMSDSSMIISNGLLLEGKLENIINKMGKFIPVARLGSTLYPQEIIMEDISTPNPHFWMSVPLWRKAVMFITDSLSHANPRNEMIYRKNEEELIVKLIDLDTFVKQQVEKIPPENRFIVTNHNSFNYFGKEYGFETASIRGKSTTGAITAEDIQNVSRFIKRNNVKVVFVEHHMPLRDIKILQTALAKEEYNIKIGGVLYSDTLGDENSPIQSYINLMMYNVDTLVQALK